MKNGKIKMILKALIAFLIMFSIIAGVYYATAVFFEYKNKQVEYAGYIEKETAIVQLGQKVLEKSISGLFSDIYYLRYIFCDNIQSYGNDNYDHLIDGWQAFLQNQGIYFKIRFIDAEGNEQIRIDCDSRANTTTVSTDLENKSDRYYFAETMALDEDQVYMSRLDLDIENGEIAEPIQPVIRLSMKVCDEEGGVLGIIVVSYDANRLLMDFDDVEATSNGEVFLINSAGYWIKYSAHEGKEWAFMYEDYSIINLRNENPELWRYMAQAESGNYITESGMYTFQSLYFDKQQGGEENVVAAENKWYVVSFVSNDTASGIVFSCNFFDIVLSATRGQKLVLLILAFFCALVVVMYMIIKNTKMKVDAFARDELTHVYNRGAGFEQLDKARKNMLKTGGKLSVCFIDINHLKEVNDKYGHEVGDELISSVVEIVKRSIRGTDFIIRLGGDEFLIVFENITVVQAEEVWSRICRDFKAFNENKNKPFEISVSHGIEEFNPEIEEFIETVVNSADEKMYNEKRLEHWAHNGKTEQ